MGAHLVFVSRVACAEGHPGDGNLTVYRVGRANDASFEHCGMLEKRLFHLLWGDVGAASNNELLQAALEPVIAVLVARSQVAGVQPAVVEQAFGGIGIVPVASAVGGTANEDFPGLALRYVTSVQV